MLIENAKGITISEASKLLMES